MFVCKTKRKKRKKRRIALFCAALFVFALILAVRGFEKKVEVFSGSYLPGFARQTATKAVCGAVEQALAEGHYSYGDFASVRYSDGRAVSVETDPAAVNELKSRVTKNAELECEKIHNSVMYIPLGAFTGLSLIANEGPKIPLTYCLTGSFSAELESTFEEAGINQTIHHIRLVVTSEIVTASVDYKDTMTFTTDFEIAQSVIVGDIPTTYGGYLTPIRG